MRSNKNTSCVSPLRQTAEVQRFRCARTVPAAGCGLKPADSGDLAEVLDIGYYSGEKCRKVSNHVENRFHAQSWPDTLRLGLVYRRLPKNDKLKHVATARPLLLTRGRTGCFDP